MLTVTASERPAQGVRTWPGSWLSADKAVLLFLGENYWDKGIKVQLSSF